MTSFADQFQSLHVDRSSGREKPHKAVLLLAVIDMIEAGEGDGVENRFEFGEALRERFTGYFELVRSGNDQPNAILPFFHMKTEKFWTLKPQPGYEKAVGVMEHPGGARKLAKVVECAQLAPELFEILRDASGRQTLREALVSRWFPEHAKDVWRRIGLEGRIGAYGRRIEALTEEDGTGAAGEDAPEEEVRDTAFRRVVTDAYDYRCTACGLRLVHDGRSIVEACHLVPWSESRDDDPRNGLALCRNHHWAMDRSLIAPGPDMIWYASKSLDKRIDGEKGLLELKGQPVIKPSKERYGPKQDALEYRLAKLA